MYSGKPVCAPTPGKANSASVKKLKSIKTGFSISKNSAIYLPVDLVIYYATLIDIKTMAA